MTALHASLLDKLARICAVPVTFSNEHKCFVYNGVRKHGLTKLLASLVPVPRSKRTAKEQIESGVVDVQVHRPAGFVLRKCGHCDDAVKSMRKLDAERFSIAKRLRSERDGDRAHGLVVDYQLTVYVKRGRAALFNMCAVVDPCVGTLIEFLDANGWCLIATQVPIYDDRIDIATAIDLLATDRATRRQMFLIETKASAANRNKDDNNDSNYERVRGELRCGALRGMPQSYYARHQMQLLCMNDAVERQCGFRFDKSMVLRVSPGVVRTYPLAAQFIARRDDIAQALVLNSTKTRKRRRGAPTAATPRKRRK